MDYEYYSESSSQDSSEIFPQTLHQAAFEGKEDEICQMIKNGVNVNTRDKYGRTALMISIEEKHGRINKILLEAGTDVNLINNNHDNALLLSIKYEKYGLTDALLDKTQDVNLVNREGKTALHMLIENKQTKLAKKLLSKGADVDAVDSNRRTSLMIACKNNDLDGVALLLKNNADVSKRDEENLSAKELANDQKIIKLIEMKSKDSPKNPFKIESNELLKIDLVEHKPVSSTSCENEVMRNLVSYPETSIVEFPLIPRSESRVPQNSDRSTLKTTSNQKNFEQNIKIGMSKPYYVSENILSHSALAEDMNNKSHKYEPSLSKSKDQIAISVKISSLLNRDPSKDESSEYIKKFSMDMQPNLSDDLNDSSSSFLVSKDNSDKSRSTKPLPPKQNYKSVKFDWEKIYGVEDGYNTVKLLKDYRRAITLEYSLGGLESSFVDSNISDRDIIGHGLQTLFMPEDELKTCNNNLLDGLETLKVTQLSQKQLMAVQDMLKKQQQNSRKNAREMEILLKNAKKLIMERKYLKNNIAKLQSISEQMEKELNQYPTKNEIHQYKLANLTLQNKIKELNNKHLLTISKIQNLKEALDKEFRKHLETKEKFLQESDKMATENNTINEFIDTFTEEAQNAHKCLLRKLNSSLKRINKLEALLRKEKFLLEDKYRQVVQVYVLLTNQKNMASNIKNYLTAMQQYKEQLGNALNNLETKSINVSDLASQLENDTKEIFRNFDKIRGILKPREKLENDNNANLSELRRILRSLEDGKQDVVKVGKQINKIRKLAEAETEKEKIQNVKETNKKEDLVEMCKSTWQMKIRRLFEYIEELRAISAESKAEETDISELKSQLHNQCNIKDDEIVESRLKVSQAFISSDATTGKVSTLSGANEKEEIKYLSRNDMLQEKKLVTKQILKSSFALSSQNDGKIPENTEQQLRGIYGRYEEKKSSMY